MVITFKLLFSTIFIIQVSAINLNFFNFNQPLAKNSSKTNDQLSTSTLSTPVQAQNSSSSDQLIQKIKHELENETEGPDASPEDNGNTTLVITPGQEIDETKGASNYQVNEDIPEEKSKVGKDKFSIWQYLPSLPNKFSEVPSLPKQETTTFTTTLTSYFTKHETVYPSCVKLQNVKSKCEGKLRTITPTATSSPMVEETKTLPSREIHPEKRSVEEQTTEIVESSTIPNLRELLEPSEMDDEYEYLKPEEIKKATPINEKFLDYPKPSSFIASLLANEPKVEFKTEYLTYTTVQKITDKASTATVIVHNCLPRDIDLKPCHLENSRPVIYTTSVIPNQLKSTQESLKTSGISPAPEHLPTVEQQRLSLMHRVNEYLMMNANRLIWGEPTYEEVDFNKDSTIIRPFPFPWFASTNEYLVKPYIGIYGNVNEIDK